MSLTQGDLSESLLDTKTPRPDIAEMGPTHKDDAPEVTLSPPRGTVPAEVDAEFYLEKRVGRSVIGSTAEWPPGRKRKIQTLEKLLQDRKRVKPAKRRAAPAVYDSSSSGSNSADTLVERLSPKKRQQAVDGGAKSPKKARRDAPSLPAGFVTMPMDEWIRINGRKAGQRDWSTCFREDCSDPAFNCACRCCVGFVYLIILAIIVATIGVSGVLSQVFSRWLNGH